MVQLKITILAALFASQALAAPSFKHHHHKHHPHPTGTGTGAPGSIPTGPFGMGNGTNSTGAGPTVGAGAGVSSSAAPVIIFSTVFVSPLPASTSAAAVAASSSAIGDSKIGTGTNQESGGDSNPADPACGPATITVTQQDTITLTVTGSSPTPLTGAPSTTKIPNPPALPTETPTSVAAIASVPPTEPEPEPSTSSPVVVSPVSSAPVVPPTTLATSTSSTTAAVASKAVATTPVNPPAPPPTSAAAPATPATPTVPAGVSGGKRGIIYNTVSLTDPFATASAISWAYNWGSSSGGLDKSIQYVPQLWGTDTDGFHDNVVASLNSGSTEVMASNEPDESTNFGGSQIDPADAANLYINNMMSFASQARLGAPAVTNANSTSPLMGTPWLRQWYQDCAGKCQVDFVPFHWYGWASGTGAQQAAALQTYITALNEDVKSIFGKPMPLWLTEFSALPIGDQNINQDFMTAALPYLDNEPSIERYSFFMASDGILVNSATSLTTIGEAYIATS